MTERVFERDEVPFDEMGPVEGAAVSQFRELAHMPPGVFLASLLRFVDRRNLSGHDLVYLIRARMRQISHLQAELFRDIADLAYCPPSGPGDPPRRTEELDEYTPEEIRCALVLTRRAADAMVGDALLITRQFPQVGEALSAGLIDLPRARVIVESVGGVDPDDAQVVVDRILEDAPELTTGQIRARIRRLLTDADPDAANKRYKAGLEERRVYAQPLPDGTAELGGQHLAADRVAAVMSRIDHLARKLRRHDDPRTMDQLRADLFLELLEGHHHQQHSSRDPLVDIRVSLDTLIGLNDRAAEIPGWGPVIADIARQALQRQTDGQWRVAITDPDDGAVLWNGTTRRRHTAAQRRYIETRQPTCSHPRCRMPAHRSDIDHLQPHAQGGPTHTHNAGPACRHDHNLHTLGIFQIEQPQPGVIDWITRHSHRYRSPPE